MPWQCRNHNQFARHIFALVVFVVLTSFASSAVSRRLARARAAKTIENDTSSIAIVPGPWFSGPAPRTAVSSLPGSRPVTVDEQNPATNAAATMADTTNSSITAAATPAPALIQDTAMFETPHGFITTASLRGSSDGAFVAIHGGGVVSALSANGDVLWTQPSLNFTRRTGRYPNYNLPFSPSISFGFDPINPYTEVGVHPFAVGDLNGDGIDDVAVAHFFQATGAIKSASATLVSVLDGRDGSFIWSHLYSGYVPEVLIANRRLIVALETGDYDSAKLLGESGARSSLDAWSFATTDVAHLWTFSTNVAWARWLALEAASDSTLMAAWTSTAPGAGGSTYGHILTLSPIDGTLSWDSISAGYPRFLRFDGPRARVVAVEQADPSNTNASYSIVTRSLIDGAVISSFPQSDAIALSFAVADVNSDGSDDWIVGDLFLSAGPVPCPDTQTCLSSTWTSRAGRVRALSGADGAQLWNQQRGAEGAPDLLGAGGVDTARPYGLLVSHNRVVAASFMPGLQDREIEALDGATGSVIWSRRQTNLLFPLFLAADDSAAQPQVRAVSSRNALYGAHPIGVEVILDNTGTNFLLRPDTPYQVVRSFDLDTGNEVDDSPLIGRTNSAAAADANGDGIKDIFVGGESGAVFALDGKSLDGPRVLWRRNLGSPIRQIQLVDVDGDGANELVVASAHAVALLDLTTGAVRYSIPYPNDILQSLALGDVNGDGKTDVIVPSSALACYRGDMGTPLWTYRPIADGTPRFSNAVVTPDRHVIAQYLVSAASNGTGVFVAPQNRGYVALNGDGTVAWSNFQQMQNSHPVLWKSTQLQSGAFANTVTFTWWDGSGATAGLRIERRDINTGAVVGTDLYTGDTVHVGSFDAGDGGLVGYGWKNSGLLGDSLTTVLSGYFPNDLAWGNFGSLGRSLVMAQFSDTISLMGTNALTQTTGSALATRSGPVQVSDLAVTDVDGDGMDDVIATPFDYDGWGLSLAAEGGYVTHPSSQPQGLKIMRVAPIYPLTPTVASRKVHGTTGQFDIDLPLAGPAGVEPRSGGANGDYQIVLTFSNPVTLGRAAVTGGIGTIASTVVETNGTVGIITVNLTGVADTQTITIALTNINDGTNSGDLSVPMVVHVGDVNGNGSVTNADVASIQARVATPVDQSNFRNDVNANGTISNADVALTQAKVGN